VSRRPSSLFRGSELPRLLLLAAIALAGWPMIVLFARPQAEDKPVGPPVTAASLTPVVPDDGVEFQALIDKAPIQARETAAYAALLERAREASASELATSSHKDLLYTHLWERPRLYRGVPVHIEGTAKRIITYEANPALTPKGRLYEAWVFSDENRAFPYVLIFEDAPPALPIGPDLFHRVTFDGYFLKLLGYRAEDKWRGAPLLVGRLRSTPPLAEAPAPMVELRNYSRRDGFFLICLLLLGYIAIRAFFQVRKALRGSRPGPRASAAPEGLPPDQVAQWLQNLPGEPDAPAAQGGPIHHEPGARVH
jgi:hypothetical protein